MIEISSLLATLAVGVLIGYLGQRSRFCIVSGLRDVWVVRSFQRIKGLIGVIVGAVTGFMVFKWLGGDINDFPEPLAMGSRGVIVATVIGALGLGFFSVLAEGCPFRQHVMAAEGRKSAVWYLVGFYLGIFYFYFVTIKFLVLMVNKIS